MQKKTRRRATRLSSAKDYDRSADQPFESSSGDALRVVSLDPETEEVSGELNEEFYREQRPPHY